MWFLRLTDGFFRVHLGFHVGVLSGFFKALSFLWVAPRFRVSGSEFFRFFKVSLDLHFFRMPFRVSFKGFVRVSFSGFFRLIYGFL